MRLHLLVVVSCMALGLVSCAHGGGNAKSSPDQLLVGTWRIILFEDLDGGTATYPFGEKPAGFLMYAADGHMAALITDPALPPCVPPAIKPYSQLPVCTVSQMQGILERSVAYWGTYSVDAAAGVVVHHVSETRPVAEREPTSGVPSGWRVTASSSATARPGSACSSARDSAPIRPRFGRNTTPFPRSGSLDRLTGGARGRRRRGCQRWSDGRPARCADGPPPGGRGKPREARGRTTFAPSRNGRRALRDHPGTGPRRLRRRLRGQGPGPRPPGGGEGRPPRPHHGGGGQGLPRGRGHREAVPPQPDHPPRGGPERARAVPGVRAASREDAGSPDRGRAASSPGGGAHRDGGGPRARPRPRRGSDPPGSQARERLRHEQGAGEDPRLRDGARLRAQAAQRRHAGLHGAGAVGGRRRRTSGRTSSRWG